MNQHIHPFQHLLSFSLTYTYFKLNLQFLKDNGIFRNPRLS